ncbi:MAG: tRNA (adenine(22)-N(1))-methyltransferase [Lachnospiraceae bacterium]
MRLSKRLTMISNICQPATVLADVGCDHAYLSIHMIETEKVKTAIAMDLREGPLAKAQENVSMYGFEEKIQLRLSDGLKKLEKNEADLVLISGMGGILICDILKNGWEKLGNNVQLVLQPQSDMSLLRHFLHDRGMVIKEEKMCIDDGKYYTCMRAVFGDVVPYENSYEYEFGKLLIDNKDEVLKQYLESKLSKTKMILKTMKAGGRGEDDEALQNMLKEYKEISIVYSVFGGNNGENNN